MRLPVFDRGGYGALRAQTIDDKPGVLGALRFPSVRSEADLYVQPREEFREIVRHKIRDVWRVRDRLIVRLTMIQASSFGCDQGRPAIHRNV